MRKWKTVIMVVIGIMFLFAAGSFAADEEGAKNGVGLMGLGCGFGAGLAIGLAALGGGIGQGLAANGALLGIARNPGASDKLFVPYILGLALIESLVLYAFVIAFFLNGKI